MANSREHMRELIRQGMDLSESGDSTEALRVFDQAAAIDPVGRAIKYLRATCLVDLGRLAEAESTLREAISESIPTMPTARLSAQMWMLLGSILRERGEPREAARCLLKATEFDVPPDASAQLWTILAACQLRFDVRAAAVSAERALGIDPAWGEAVSIREEARQRLADN